MRDPACGARRQSLLRVAHVEAGERERDGAGAGGDDRRGQPGHGDGRDRGQEDEGVAAAQVRGQQHREEERRSLGHRSLLIGDRGGHEHADRERPARDAGRDGVSVPAKNSHQDDGARPAQGRDHQALR